MRKIAELNVLMRTRVALPDGMNMVTEEFREGWDFVRSGKAKGLEKKILKRGWNFIKIADGLLRSGVGKTSQEAISNALKLTLRRVSEHFNAVEVERIELTTYPWFTLARVRVYPYRIQQNAVVPVMDEAPAATDFGPRQFRSSVGELCPLFGSATPLLKEILVAAGGTPGRAR